MMVESASKPLSPSREESGVYNRDVAVVHCSAGVGRTGVFILVDTAMCLIEANEPVYPQETLRNMRRWRALLVQNYVSFKILYFSFSFSQDSDVTLWFSLFLNIIL